MVRSTISCNIRWFDNQRQSVGHALLKISHKSVAKPFHHAMHACLNSVTDSASSQLSKFNAKNSSTDKNFLNISKVQKSEIEIIDCVIIVCINQRAYLRVPVSPQFVVYLTQPQTTTIESQVTANHIDRANVTEIR